MLKLRNDIEPKIDRAVEIYPTILQCLLDYTAYVDENGDEENTEYKRVVAYLSELTGKNIADYNYAIWEYWEVDGEHIESFKIALPEPVIVHNITMDELTEIVTRIHSIKLPVYLLIDFILKNGFQGEICDYYHQFLKLNFSNYSYEMFNRKKNTKGEWFEPTVQEILERLLLNN